jgi:hypothetical protein
LLLGIERNFQFSFFKCKFERQQLSLIRSIWNCVTKCGNIIAFRNSEEFLIFVFLVQIERVAIELDQIYSFGQMLKFVCHFIKKNCYFQMGMAECRQAATPCSSGSVSYAG